MEHIGLIEVLQQSNKEFMRKNKEEHMLYKWRERVRNERFTTKISYLFECKRKKTMTKTRTQPERKRRIEKNR